MVEEYSAIYDVAMTSNFGWSANMEKIMQSQTLSDASKQACMRGKRILVINPRYPIIKELHKRVVKNAEDESVKLTARLIYNFALMKGVSNFPDPKIDGFKDKASTFTEITIKLKNGIASITKSSFFDT
ncbi:PREDICTED: heat shock [Prunus dulcis]|uniref:PREDICTED: heat shock n=1 Tax=Prunus dulcis TaxID=3755 RepID=A0A5E4EXR2_PRUDU|nr:endoplasmin homolog [Prunus dulcis]VVA19589.1 PREDICTED: heat shock [Prunus dulcis]